MANKLKSGIKKIFNMNKVKMTKAMQRKREEEELAKEAEEKRVKDKKKSEEMRTKMLGRHRGAIQPGQTTLASATTKTQEGMR
tara:strand:+ start:95 stop:343 length:249 start_codon:yes stop_codon:yes gene_type:complete